jgi:RNA polymerase sigma factor (sigma-70 family)
MKIAAEIKLKHGTLYELCQQHGGVKGLAEKLGIGDQTVYQWLRMRRVPKISRHFTQAVADRLVAMAGMPLDEIFPKELEAATELFKQHGTRVTIADVPVEQLAVLHRQYVDRLTCEDPSEIADRKDYGEKVLKLLKFLTEREREIIELRFGLGDDGVCYTLEEVGHICKVTGARVRQIEARALRKIQNLLAREGISPESFDVHFPPDFDKLDRDFARSQNATLIERVTKS